MFIYVVKTGDSLYSIATKYHVSMDSIWYKNALNSDRLVPGQDLIIPTNMYIVQPGDSLYSIAQMALLPMETIRLINCLCSDELWVGMNLYIPPRVKYFAKDFGYITPSTPEKNQIIVQRFASITNYYGIFEYHIFEDGSLSSIPNDEQLVTLVGMNNVAPLAVITNLTQTGFSQDLVGKILNNPELSQRVIDHIYNLVKSKNYAGVNIDFEKVRGEDRDKYSCFLCLLRERLRPEGYCTSVALPAKTSDEISWLQGYDYGGIGASVDFVFIMAYDWHEVSSLPGPVAPINEVRKTIEYAQNYIRRNKIILGVARYGYDWMMSNGKVESARAISVMDAMETAMKYQAPIQYSIEDQQPFYRYRDESGKLHIVWFEDVKALAQKLQMVVDYQLKGIGAWQLGLHFPQAGYLVDDFLTKQL
ncbi:glycosyl hydrolase family 18 protein [Peribacillus loiseleuriae]|uniref:glycosyl hydrolase family 18 protein n=1 Tax=Peribacillus loiseleuriae TaxID=1679170 RepID=UPI003CFC7333